MLKHSPNNSNIALVKKGLKCDIIYCGRVLLLTWRNQKMNYEKDINKIIASVSASLAVEGLKPSDAGTAITRQYLEGKISSKQAIQRIKDKHLKVAVK